MNIDLKGVTFSILLAALGVGLIVIGAAEKLTISGNAVQVSDLRFRVVLLVFGGLLLVGAIAFQILEVRKRAGGPSIPAQTADEAHRTTPINAEEFFLTLDDEHVASFPTSVIGAIRLQILARTVVNLVGQYGKTFDELARSGCDVQILVVDPESDAAHHVYGNSYALFRRNAQTALGHLATLQQKHGDHFQVRFFSYVPTVSIMTVEKHDAAASYAQVQMYFIHGAIGRDRPIFRVRRTDHWYEVFREEFESIWRAFPDTKVAGHLDKV